MLADMIWKLYYGYASGVIVGVGVLVAGPVAVGVAV
jgi:hypothetical protein